MEPEVKHWDRSKGESPPVLTATCAVNGLGLSARQTWAFWRAELSPFIESPFRAPNGSLVPMSLMRTLPVRCFGTERILALATRALQELLPQLAGLPDETRVSLFAGLSTRFDREDRESRRARERIRLGLDQWLQRRWPTAVARCVAHGHASFARALQQASLAIEADVLDVALVGGVDTYYDPRYLEELMVYGRVFDTEDLDSFVPGEGAAFLVLCAGRTARRLSLPALGVVETIANGVEPAHMYSEAPCMARGLSQVMRAVTTRLKQQRRQVSWVLGDVTNEQYRTHEWLLATPRAFAPGGLDGGKDFFEIIDGEAPIDFMPEWFGELGAATMATAAVIAVEAFGRGDPPAENCLIPGSSETEHRGSVLLGSRIR